MPPGLVLGIAEKLAQRGRGRRGHAAQQLAAGRRRQVAQGIDRLVGLHGGQEARRLVGIGLAQQLFEVVGLHLLEGVGRLVGAQRRQQLLALVAAEVLEQVGQLAGAQAVQPFVGGLEADLGGPVDRVRRLAEGLDRRPVDDAIRRGQRAPAARPQPAQQRGRRHIGTDQPYATQHLGQVEIGRPDDLHAVHVDQLVVQDVLGQEHLAGAADHVLEVEPGRAQQHLGVRDPIDGRGGDEGQPAPHPDDQSGHGRVGLPVGPAGHDVVEPADLLAGLVGDRPAENAGQGHDGVEHALGRQDAAGAAAALVRRALGRRRDGGEGRGRYGPAICRRGWSQGATSCAAPARRSGRKGRRGARERHPKKAATSTFSIPTPATTSGQPENQQLSRRRRGEVCR